MTSTAPRPTSVPTWANGTFIWKLCLADHVVYLTNVLGADQGFLPWDGLWPYWQRLTYRVPGWDALSRFMVEMRERHHAAISFHLNLTDVNAGLRLYPETRAFFERLRDARAIYSRPTGRDQTRTQRLGVTSGTCSIRLEAQQSAVLLPTSL